MQRIQVNGKEETEARSITDHFNEFFVDIGAKLAAKISGGKNPLTYVTKSNQYKFRAQTIDGNKILHLIKSLKKGKATGLDGISVRMLKAGSSALCDKLTYLFNFSIMTGEVPDLWKHKRVCPVYKSGSKTSTQNYRPISILPVASKMLEKIIHEQLYDYLLKREIINPKQSGFRRNHSTATATIDVSDHILSEMAKGKIVAAVFIDLAKAFDTVDHSILLKKMDRYGVQGTEQKWLKSYLSDRHQVTSVNDSQSAELQEKEYGVPQGSVLGPLLFICYINDIQASLNCVSHIYADDTVLLFSNPEVEALNQNVQAGIKSVAEWLSSNKLTLNVGKTEYMLFANKRKLNLVRNFDLNINETKIKRTEKFKYLGVYFDPTLSLKEHINITAGKLKNKLNKIERAIPYLTNDTKKLLFNALILPHIDYCSEVWSSASNACLKKVASVYNRSLRLLEGKNDKYCNLNTRLEKNILKMMFKSVNKISPVYLQKRIKLAREIHSRTTRSALSKKIFIEKRNTKSEAKLFTTRAASLWNSLPYELTSLDSFLRFKISIEDYYRDKN